MNETIWDPLRKKEVALTPEERVRQWFIGVLRDNLGVPAHMMMSEVGFKFGDKQYRGDIIVYRRDLSPAAVVECKRPEVELTKETLAQAIRYNMALGVSFIIITNGRSTIAWEEGRGFLEALPGYAAMAAPKTSAPKKDK